MKKLFSLGVIAYLVYFFTAYDFHINIPPDNGSKGLYDSKFEDIIKTNEPLGFVDDVRSLTATTSDSVNVMQTVADYMVDSMQDTMDGALSEYNNILQDNIDDIQQAYDYSTLY